jgi:hypothetical protein
MKNFKDIYISNKWGLISMNCGCVFIENDFWEFEKLVVDFEKSQL